jgi:hypothetical protein
MSIMNIRTMAAILLAACASTAMADEPVALRPPAGQVLSLELLARGVQVYECAAAKDQPERFEWTFKGPEAALFYRGGRGAGLHYAGPTWQAIDGSTVVAKVEARDDGPDPRAIPWLLLRAVSTTGEGLFSRVLSIQRLDTAGGKAPAEPCSAGRVARVPYSATYSFFVAEH